MKFYLKYSLVFFAICSFVGCIPIDSDERVVSFWTNQHIEGEVTLLINDQEEGELESLLLKPNCGDDKLVSIPLVDDSDIIVRLLTNDGEVVDLGLINLFSVSNGIMIKPETDSSLYVYHDLDDQCTMVELKW